jgi:UDP-N-acetylmuramoyl-tripeptide--D-alanyl-D-alanine ligase
VIEVRASDVARAISGHVVGDDVTIRGVAIDSRVADRGSLFVALRGRRTDGHLYVADAFTRGASVAVVSRTITPVGRTSIHVEDTDVALLALGRWWRSRLRADTIGITGSVGKTTTKDVLATVLADRWRVTASPRSYNNGIGIPMTLFGADTSTDVLVCEIGAGAVGEIEKLCGVARPRIGIVTAVGPAHLATFGSLDGIAEAKAELVRALPRDGVAILNADDPRVASFAARTRARVVTFGRSEHASVRAERVTLDAVAHPSFVAIHEGSEANVTLRHLVGEHMVIPAMAALATAITLGIPLDEAAATLDGVAPSPGRMETRRTPDGVTILDDTYNANPLSMRAALAALGHIQARRRLAVLGRMAELGEADRALHEEVGGAAASANLDRLITVGHGASPIADGARASGMPSHRIGHCVDGAEAAVLLRRLVVPGDVVLVKGSRVNELDRIVARLLSAGRPRHPGASTTATNLDRETAGGRWSRRSPSDPGGS